MSSIEVLAIVTSLSGGLALFLFGMHTMSASLEKMTGGFLGKMTRFITKSRFSAFLFGAGLTAIVQSSSAITVLSVGLVNAGLIGLDKAAGLIIGANLGTTATSWILSLNTLSTQSFFLTLLKPSSFSPFLAIIGIVLVMFARSEKRKDTGSAALGFSVMMIGMNMMSQGVSPLRDVPVMKDMLVSVSNPLSGFGFSLLFTMIIQSSDATIGILQAFAVTIGVPFGSAIPLICGAQVGTCITAIISSLATSNNGKRTACMNLYYNLFKTLPPMLVFYLLNSIFRFRFLDSPVGAIGIPAVHTLINAAAAVIWIPAADVLVLLARHTIRLSREEKEEREDILAMLDPILLTNPSFALKQTDEAVGLLAETAGQTFHTLTHYETEPDLVDKLKRLFRRSESYQDQISSYLTQLSSHGLPESDAPLHTLLMNANTAFGQIGFLTRQILQAGKQAFYTEIQLPASLLSEIYVFADAIYDIIDITILGFREKEPSLSYTIQLYREEITRLTSLVYLRNIENGHRMNAGDQASVYSLLQTEILYTEEKLIDCCDIVAYALRKYAQTAGTGEEGSPADEEARRRQVKKLFKDKYEMLGL